MTTPYKIHNGNSLEVLKTLDENSIDSIVCDPPYELGFMNKKWDSSGIAYNVELWKECLRVLKPGGHLLAFSGSRTYHRMAVAIEDAGFDIRDQIMWVYGCLSEDTDIVTPNGITSYKEIKIGDLVLCYDKDSEEYSYLPIEDIYEYDIKDTAYRITSDFTDQIVSRNHRCLVERNGIEVFVFAEECSEKEIVPFIETEYTSITDIQHSTTLATITPFEYEGKVWCVKVPTGSFVAVRNGKAFPTGNSGFPKSHDVSKAIDKKAGVEREKYINPNIKKQTGQKNTVALNNKNAVTHVTPYAATEEAKQWQGWGTALKPAHEPICLARKPFDATVGGNVMLYGTGAINIDGCRIEISENDDPRLGGKGEWKTDKAAKEVYSGGYVGDNISSSPLGRFPANFIHDGSDEVVSLFPDTSPSKAANRGLQHSSRHGGLGDIGGNIKEGTDGIRGHNDDGGSAARFFYCAKASKRDRDEGLDGFEIKTLQVFGDYVGTPEHAPKENIQRRNFHPTVKPTTLMQYLCRLITPPNGIVLDPFMGSGSTGKAAMYEGFRFIGIDLEPEYCQIAEARIEFALNDKGKTSKPKEKKPKPKEQKPKDTNSSSLW